MATNNAINQRQPVPAFRISLPGNLTNFTGNSAGGIKIIPFDTVVYDTTSSFNTGSYTYVVPTTGYWHLSATIVPYGLAAINNFGRCYFDVNAGTYTYIIFDANPSVMFENVGFSNALLINGSDLVYLTVGDLVIVRFGVYSGTQVVSLGQNSFFAGILVATT